MINKETKQNNYKTPIDPKRWNADLERIMETMQANKEKSILNMLVRYETASSLFCNIPLIWCFGFIRNLVARHIRRKVFKKYKSLKEFEQEVIDLSKKLEQMDSIK